MASKFKLLALSVKGKPLPRPSLPLVVCGNHHWNPETFTLTSQESQGSQDNDTLRIVPEGLELLRSITKPVAILSICGPSRTGKSYFLSRLLGTSEIFKIGHKFEACTHGIWISTTALECDDFVVVFLDTEGMDAIGASETTVTNLLIVNVLLSSYLVYNSQSVPEWSDLEDLSCFTQLSCSILAQEGAEIEELSKCFPDFLWLIRDQTLQLSTDDGIPPSPTTYLKENVLVRSSNAIPTTNDHVVNAILTLFPSIECFMLPRPSADANVLSHIMDQEENLDKDFISKFHEVKEFIFQKIGPKRVSALEHCAVNGSLLAELAVQYVDAISSDKCLILDNSYLTAVEKELHDIVRRLIKEYQSVMEGALSGKLPIEVYSDDESEETLLSIHNTIYAKKLEALKNEMTRFLPKEISDVAVKKSVAVIGDRITEKFNKMIAVLEETSEVTNPQVKDGALLRFIIENHTASEQSCRELINSKYQQVERTIHTVLVNKTESDSSDIESEWSTMEKEYLEESVGPAKHEVLAQKRSILEKSVQVLKHVPGPPREVKVIGIARDKIKLAWNGVAYNEDVVDHYEVEVQTDSEHWTPLSNEFRENHAVIDNLETETKYWFQVRAVSKPTESQEGMISYTSNPSSVVSEKTRVSAVRRGTSAIGGFVAGSVASPFAATIATPYLGPAATVGGLLVAPVTGAILAYKWYKDQGPCKGDLEEHGQDSSSKQ